MVDAALALSGASGSSRPAEAMTDRMAERLAAEERALARLAMRGRTVALSAVAFLVLLVAPYPAVVFYEILIAIFILLGFVRLWLEYSEFHQAWHEYALTAVDFALLAFTLLYPNPFMPADYPPQLAIRFGNFVYFFVLLAGLAFTFRPLLVLWGGAVGALSWGAGAAWLAALPDTVLLPIEGPASLVAAQALPTFVNLEVVTQEMAVFLIVASLIAVVVSRSRRLVFRQARLERDRANLARYFKPATVDRLASQDAALAQIREQDVAILFADLVGFTHWAERHSPAEVIRLLREVHARLEGAVFRHDGTLDKFIGDGMMATFGTPDPGPRDATNALACLDDILTEFEAWNTRRRRGGQEPVRISLGLHYGPVVVGNIGTDRRLEFGVLGDTVNVAKRLEAITRDLGCKAVISAAVAEAVREEAAGGEDLLQNFQERAPQTLRGRDEEVPVLTFGRP